MFALNLYNQLMALTLETDSPFYYVDQLLDNSIYRIFNYRLANYTDFCKDGARECRGHMFQITPEGQFIRFAAMPMAKFFNLNENPFTLDFPFDNVQLIMDKVDGSLISSYVHHPAKIRLKSKAALASDQAIAAMATLEKLPKLAKFVEVLTANGWTVNMEYVAPDNRIVLPYQKADLIVLNVRKLADGSYWDYKSLKEYMIYADCAEHLVPNIAETIAEVNDFVNSIPSMTGIEGFVVVTGKDSVKVKTEWYQSLHRAKDSVNSPKALYEVVVNEAHDDLRAAFSEDQWVLGRIAAMEVLVKAIYAKIKAGPEAFYAENKELDRKSFAIKGQSELDRMFFGIAMTLYLGKEVNYKEFLLKHYKEFGILDLMETKDNELFAE
jgi:T4 RnlA family RNA ligase